MSNIKAQKTWIAFLKTQKTWIAFQSTSNCRTSAGFKQYADAISYERYAYGLKVRLIS